MAAENPEDYISELSAERQEAMNKLRKLITENLPKGFSETISYGMIGYVVPHSIYPAGYHCNPKLPLPFLSIASQKNFISVYHMGIYADQKLMDWFMAEYPKHSDSKLDMGKSCIRFKKINEIPYKIIGKLAGKMSVKEWIALYDKTFK